MKCYEIPTTRLFRELVVNLAMGIPWIRRRRLKSLRTSHGSIEIEAAKIIAEFDFFASSIGSLEGLVIAEIGPGDAVGLAPMLISSGAVSYFAIDRFLGDVWGERANELYRELERQRGPFIDGWRNRVVLHPASIEAPSEGLAQFDVIISFDVIEHLADVSPAVRNMVSLLKPDGRMIHRVDYGAHGIWSTAEDPLIFLELPNWLWRAMGSNRGYPNRVPHSEFIRLLQASNLTVAERVTRSCGPTVLDAEIACGFAADPSLGPEFHLE